MATRTDVGKAMPTSDRHRRRARCLRAIPQLAETVDAPAKCLAGLGDAAGVPAQTRADCGKLRSLGDGLRNHHGAFLVELGLVARLPAIEVVRGRDGASQAAPADTCRNFRFAATGTGVKAFGGSVP